MKSEFHPSSADRTTGNPSGLPKRKEDQSGHDNEQSPAEKNVEQLQIKLKILKEYLESNSESSLKSGDPSNRSSQRIESDVERIRNSNPGEPHE